MDINCDLGEEFHKDARLIDRSLMPFVTSCNIACGFHSGNLQVMRETVRLAMNHKVLIGAHPSYRDRNNFGRISQFTDAQSLQKDILEQLNSLDAICQELDAQIHHVKPHGALYHDISEIPAAAQSFAEAITTFDPHLKVMVMADSKAYFLFKKMGLACIQEGFADRQYLTKNSLVPRHQHESLIIQKDKVKQRVKNLCRGQLQLSNGQLIPVQVDSICIHSDTPQATSLARSIHHWVESECRV